MERCREIAVQMPGTVVEPVSESAQPSPGPMDIAALLGRIAQAEQPAMLVTVVHSFIYSPNIRLTHQVLPMPIRHQGMAPRHLETVDPFPIQLL